tara:strand:- start:2157 stop:2492 length:336 start_codon:yes stop_codon:yes gene_type:complete
MNIIGKVHEIGKTQQVNDTFKKRDLILEVAENPTYPEYIKFDTIQDKTALLDGLKVGNTIDVAFNLRGRAWTNKEGVVSYFNSLVAWKVTESIEVARAVVIDSDPVNDLPF